jgi:hypothetical protein
MAFPTPFETFSLPSPDGQACALTVPRFVVNLFQAFNQDRTVNPSTANKGKALAVGRDGKMRDFFVAQIGADTATRPTVE